MTLRLVDEDGDVLWEFDSDGVDSILSDYYSSIPHGCLDQMRSWWERVNAKSW